MCKVRFFEGNCDKKDLFFFLLNQIHDCWTIFNSIIKSLFMGLKRYFVDLMPQTPVAKQKRFHANTLTSFYVKSYDKGFYAVDAGDK